MENCVGMIKQWKYLLLIIVLSLMMPISGCGRESNEVTSPGQGTTTVETREKQDETESTGARKYTSRGTPYVNNEGMEIFESIDLIPVNSSALESIGYSKEDKVLAVVFIKSGKYIYYDVSESVFKEFLEAESKGRYFNSDVKGQYYCEKVE